MQQRKQSARLPFHSQDSASERHTKRSSFLSVNSLVLCAVSTTMLLAGAIVGETHWKDSSHCAQAQLRPCVSAGLHLRPLLGYDAPLYASRPTQCSN